jgi:hypothetical protein
MTISTVTVTPAEISAALEPAYNTTTFAPTFTRS